jgi:hypothetical protein
MYFDGAGTFSYQVAAGGTTNVVTGSTFLEKRTVSIPITSGQLLTVAWVAGNIFIDGILHYAGDENSGITFHGCGHTSWSATNWNAPETFSLNWPQCYANGFPATAAVAFMLGANDANTGGGNETASAFQSVLTALVANVRGGAAALAAIPAPMIAEYAVNFTLADRGGWPAYTTAVRGTAGAAGLSHVTDLSYRMPSVISNWNGGILYADGSPGHPTNLGHALIGEIIAAGTVIA